MTDDLRTRVSEGFFPQYYSTFSAQGPKGSVYTVSLAGTDFAHCDCPTYFKGEPSDRTCKHIAAIWVGLFVAEMISTKIAMVKKRVLRQA